MIITRLVGGLGNQMFQYAVGRRLALANETQLKLDLTEFTRYKLHRYGLDNFNIRASVAASEESKRLQISWFKRRHIIEKELNVFTPQILRLRGEYYLEGYWQSDKYFSDITEVIRDDFKIITEPTVANKELAQKIGACQSISVHVRRGDYVNNPETFKVHGVCGLEYYQRAAEFLSDKISQPVFFVFSDDPTWAKNNLRFAGQTVFVDGNGADKNYEDLRLMSLCRHNIIANSSFSWWGAWLNKHPEKIVIAPARWFKDSARNSQDMIPAAWIKI